MDRDKTMALFHARNAVLRVLHELEIAHFEVESLGYSAAFFSRVRTDLGMLAQRLLNATHDEWRRREQGKSVAPGTAWTGPVAEPQAKSNQS